MTATATLEHALSRKPVKGRHVAELQVLLGIRVPSGEYDHATAVAVYRRKLLLGYGDKANHNADPKFIEQLRVAGTIAPPGSSSRTPLDLTETGTYSLQAVVAEACGHLEKHGASDHETKVRLATIDAWHLIIQKGAHVYYPPGDIRRRSVYAIATVPQLLAAIAAKGGLYADCSQTVDIVCHVSGAKNPNTGTNSWRNDGYTGTEIQGCITIPKAQVRPGDLHVYGPGTGHHVAQALTGGPDPLMGSHGHNPPVAVRDSVESAWQPPGGRWLRLPI